MFDGRLKLVEWFQNIIKEMYIIINPYFLKIENKQNGSLQLIFFEMGD